MLSFRNGAISAAVAAAIASTTMSVTPANASPRGDALVLAKQPTHSLGVRQSTKAFEI